MHLETYKTPCKYYSCRQKASSSITLNVFPFIKRLLKTITFSYTVIPKGGKDTEQTTMELDVRIGPEILVTPLALHVARKKHNLDFTSQRAYYLYISVKKFCTLFIRDTISSIWINQMTRSC